MWPGPRRRLESTRLPSICAHMEKAAARVVRFPCTSASHAIGCLATLTQRFNIWFRNRASTAMSSAWEGPGYLGVDNSVQAARRHSAEVKSLVLLSGETFQPSLQFLRQASQLPGLFVVADDDEYPPTVQAMELLYITSSDPGKKFVHYSAAQEAPWVWYEPNDVGKVPANGGRGTDMFKPHPELVGTIGDWFVTTLIKTPGHAPADTLASAPILNQIRMPGGIAQVGQQLVEARQKDPQAQ